MTHNLALDIEHGEATSARIGYREEAIEPPGTIEDIAEWLPSRLPETSIEEEAFVAKLRPLILKLIRSHRPKRETEEDMLQIIFIKLFSKFHQYSGAVPLVHWVSRIAINTCLNQIRREKHMAVLFSDLPDWDLEEAFFQKSSGLCSPSEAAAQNEQVAGILSQLNTEDRFLLELLYLQSYSVREASQRTGLSESAVKVRAYRARAKLTRGGHSAAAN